MGLNNITHSLITTFFSPTPPQTTAPIRGRVLYDRLVHFFPTSGRYWRLYIEQEVTSTLSSSNSLHDLCPLFLPSLSHFSCAPFKLHVSCLGKLKETKKSCNMGKNREGESLKWGRNKGRSLEQKMGTKMYGDCRSAWLHWVQFCLLLY